MEYPLFELLISEDEENLLEVSYVALVDMPVINRNFITFSNQWQAFATVDEERHIISGSAMLADVPLFRKVHGDIPDHMVLFKPDTI